MCFDCGFENDEWWCWRIVKLVFSGSLVDGIPGDGEDPVKEMDAVVFEQIILVFDVAKEFYGVDKSDGMGGDVICLHRDGIPEGCKVLAVEQEVG